MSQAYAIIIDFLASTDPQHAAEKRPLRALTGPKPAKCALTLLENDGVLWQVSRKLFSYRDKDTPVSTHTQRDNLQILAFSMVSFCCFFPGVSYIHENLPRTLYYYPLPVRAESD